MHIPSTLGGYPLILRDVNSSIQVLHKGELLLDYTDYKLYYINRESEKKIDIAKSIYDKIVLAKAENSKIVIGKESEYLPSEEPLTPAVEDRKPNTWYMNIYQ